MWPPVENPTVKASLQLLDAFTLSITAVM